MFLRASHAGRTAMIHPIYQQSLPPTASSSTIVGVWALSVADAELPILRERARAAACYLVDRIVRDLPPDRQLRCQIDVMDSGLRITVRAAGQGIHAGGLELAENSDPLTSIGLGGDAAGLEAWAELRTKPAVLA